VGHCRMMGCILVRDAACAEWGGGGGWGVEGGAGAALDPRRPGDWEADPWDPETETRGTKALGTEALTTKH
jgi:hypothetical protein